MKERIGEELVHSSVMALCGTALNLAVNCFLKSFFEACTVVVILSNAVA